MLGAGHWFHEWPKHLRHYKFQEALVCFQHCQLQNEDKESRSHLQCYIPDKCWEPLAVTDIMAPR